MPANLPAEAKAKWLKVSEAKTPEEKLKALRDFLSSVPRHKGTERIIMQARRQMGILRKQIQEEKKKRQQRKSGPSFFIEKEGAAQIILIGEPNTGKSALMRCLTKVNTISSENAFETRRPIPGILEWKGVYLQIVDSPSIVKGSSKGFMNGLQVLTLIKNSDGIIIVLDALKNPLNQIKNIENELKEAKIILRKKNYKIVIEKKRFGGINIFGRVKDASESEIQSLLRSYGINHANIWIKGEATISNIEEQILFSYTYKPSIIFINKIDLLDKDSIDKIIQKAKMYLDNKIPVFPCSSIRCELPEVDGIFKFFLKELELIRVYTRNPRTGVIERKPIILRKNSKVIDAAKMVHSRLYKNFKYAKIWSPRLRFSPQKVGKDFVLEDGDIIEIIA